MRQISGEIRELTKDYNEVNAALDDLKNPNPKPLNENLFAKIKKFLSGSKAEHREDHRQCHEHCHYDCSDSRFLLYLHSILPVNKLHMLSYTYLYIVILSH